jgi:hypothetical protein
MMCEQQYQAEVMDELKQQEYNSNFGTGESSDDLHSRRNSATNGQVWQMGQTALYQGQVKSN